LEHQFDNLRVIVNSMLELLSMLCRNVSLVPKKITSDGGQSWCLILF